MEPYKKVCWNCRRLFLYDKNEGRCPMCIARIDWRSMWVKALNNMPAMAICKNPLFPKFSAQSHYRRGSATALRMCLGYQVYAHTLRNGKLFIRSNAVASNYNAMQRGAIPRGKHRQSMLQALASPHGVTVARVRLIQLGQADRFKHWPKENA